MSDLVARLGRAVLVVVVAGAAASRSANGQPAPLDGLDRYVEQSMKAWKVPGLAIAVVKGDRVILARGFGVRELGKAAPVTENTLFAIGSATKAFTATVAGILTDRGNLSLDDRATKHLPSFELADPYASREVTIRDLMTHRTGVAGGDLLWASGGFDRAEIVRRIRFVPPTWSFRSRFDYSNIMFIAAGEAIAAAGGASLDRLFGDLILTPLGMTRSTTSIRALRAGDDVATPHDPTDSLPRTVPWRNMDNTLAGGGINSSAADMARWLELQLGGGVFRGRRLVSEAFILESRTPQTVIRREGPWAAMTPDAHFVSYGLGWIISDYHGQQLLQHGGGIDGMSAMVGLLPERGVGIVALTNLNGNQVPAALMYWIVDRYLDRSVTDWSDRALQAARADQVAAAAAQQRETARRVTGTTPSLPLPRYAGRYRHPAWGDVEVRAEAGGLVIEYGTEFIGTLEHVQHDAFRARWHNPARGADYLNFTIDVRREPARLDLYLWTTATFDRVQ
jgi:CubicO group peptidase (beta-lactamase class C family)